MKKYLFFLAIAFSVTSMAYGQFELKASAGINMASLAKPPVGEEYTARTGYQFGGGVLIGDKFYVEPGVYMVRSTRDVSWDVVEDFEFDQNFVKIPVYAGYHLLGHESGPIALRIFAGPSVSIAGKIKKGEDQISRDDIKDAHWMVDAGVGLDVLFLFAELNYEYAFSKYFVDETHDSSHKGFLINVGIHLDF